MSREESYTLLVNTIAGIVNTIPENITPDTTFAEDLGFTPQGLQSLANVLNEEYGQHGESPALTGNEIAQAGNVRNLEALIWGRIGG